MNPNKRNKVSKRKTHTDPDYMPEKEEVIHDSKRVKKGASSQKRVRYSFLDQHASKIWYHDNQNLSASDIASVLCLELGLPKNSLDGKQISNWMDYKKKSRTGKPRSVSAKNNNLKADSEDNTCMIHDYYLIIVCT
jgi:hypothetical protein